MHTPVSVQNHVYDYLVKTSSAYSSVVVTYLQVFVDRTPLLKASEYSIIVTITVVFGAVIAFTYLVHHFRLTPDHLHK